MPSSRILEQICWGENGSRQYTHFSPPYNELMLCSFFEGLVIQIPHFYNHNFKVDFDNERGKINLNRLGVVWEVMSNAFAHGEANKFGLTYALIMGQKGMCHGFYDGGDFFKAQEIKEAFEKKHLLKERDQSPKVDISTHGLGHHFIYMHSDLIEVDSANGILYCVQYINPVKKAE